MKRSGPVNTKSPYMPTPDDYLNSLPPDSSKTEDEDRSGWQKAKRTFGWFLLCFLLLILGYGAYIAINVAKISTKPFNLAPLGADESRRSNVLILVGSSRVDLQACKLEYSIVSPK